MAKYIYLKNLPLFERYELIDTNENTWKSTRNVGLFNNRGIRSINSLYIKGINKISDEDRKIDDYKVFFKDYLNLGKKLFELSISKNKMSFIKPILIDDDSLIESKYNEEIMDMSNFNKKYGDLIDDINGLYNSIENEIDVDNDYVYNYIYNLLSTVDKILSSLAILDKVFNYNVKEELHALYDFFLEYYNYFFEETDDIKLIDYKFNYLDELIESIDNIKKENGFNLKKELALSNAKKRVNYDTNYVEFNNYFKESPIDVRFTYDQIKDLKRIIITWLKKYGFPYYVKKEDELEYREKIKSIKEFNISDNEFLIPCEHLIVNSIYIYLFYSILVEQQEADSVIKYTFGIRNKFTRDKLKEINELRNNYKYYFYNVCDEIFDIKLKSDKNEISITKEEKKESKNHFIKGTNIDFYELYFNNLCIAANIWLEEETKYTVFSDKKQCPICKRWFSPEEFKYKKYCSDKCQKEGNRKQENLNKKKNRKEKKQNQELLNRIFNDD